MAAAHLCNTYQPLTKQRPPVPNAPEESCRQVADSISAAKKPIIMAGNGVIRAKASDALVQFAEKLNIPVTTTFMAKVRYLLVILCAPAPLDCKHVIMCLMALKKLILLSVLVWTWLNITHVYGTQIVSTKLFISI